MFKILFALFFTSLLSFVASGRDLLPEEFRLCAHSSVSEDGSALVLDSTSVEKDFGWRRYAYAGKDWFLEKGARCKLSFKARLEAAGKGGRILVLIRPVNENSHHFDCGSATVIPTGEKAVAVDLKFTVGDRSDYCIQIHSWNRVKAEIYENNRQRKICRSKRQRYRSI